MNSRNCLILVLQCLVLVGCVAMTQLSGTVSSAILKSDKGLNCGWQSESARGKLGDGQYEVLCEIYDTMPSSLGYLEIGIASWYGRKFHGRLTAMGEVYDMYALSAAHKALPLPTMVRVTNLDNGSNIVLRVNDRGPFHDDRLIDLSYGAARALGFENQGTAPVVVEAIDEINYPELAKNVSQESYYLQAGAFIRREGAELQMKKVKNVLPPDVQVRILISETDKAVLHKIWIGPMASIREEKLIVERVQDRNLGNPVRVIIDRE